MGPPLKIGTTMNIGPGGLASVFGMIS